MEIDYSSIQNKKPKNLEEEEEETQETGSDLAESPTASVSYFKIPSFFLKTFRKRIDEKEISSSEIEKKKKWLIEVASLFYKIFGGGGKFSACRIGSKIDVVEDEDYSSSESEEAGEEDDYRDERETTELNDGSETEKKFRRDHEKISSQTSRILYMFSKRKNSINFNFDFDFSFNFIKSRICKGKNGNRNRNNLDYDQDRFTEFGRSRENPKRTIQIPSRERKQIWENSTASSSYREDDGDEEEQLWQKRILMGERCKPLLNTSVSHRSDRNAMLFP